MIGIYRIKNLVNKKNDELGEYEGFRLFQYGKNDLFTNDIYSIAIWGASGSTYQFKAESLNRNILNIQICLILMLLKKF
jgi:hypothetical protein